MSDSVIDILKKRIDNSPSGPGVYRWLDEDGAVLYIGKAKNLKKRLLNYVLKMGVDQGVWKAAMMQQVRDVDWTITRTELEALILETNLIKENKPKYNVLMKDDKNYVYVRITTQDPFPHVEITRRITDDGAKEFGPFLSAYDLRRTLDMLQEILGYRACKDSIERGNRAAREGRDASEVKMSCLECQIGQCCGLCAGLITPEDYRSRIDALVRFFRGSKDDILKRAKEEMQRAAVDRKFERAAKLRDAIAVVEGLEAQNVSDTSGDNVDFIAIALSRGKSQAVVLRERGGKLIGEHALALRGSPEKVEDALVDFLPQYYSTVTEIPDRIVIAEDIPDRELLEQWLTERRKRKATIVIPERGKKSKLLELAERNAAEKIRQQEAKWEAAERNLEDALTELTEMLKLGSTPKRIEGYDISHMGGTETVGSMVVMLSGKPNSKLYRSFTIRTLREGDVDDYKALAEVLRRRLRHLQQSIDAEKRRWEGLGITFGKALKQEEPAIQAILDAHPQHFGDREITYKDFMVARKGEEIVAFARLIERDGILLIKSVWVHDANRGRKLGHAVIQRLLAKLKKGKVYVTIEGTLEEYYALLGFRAIREPPEQIQKQIDAIMKTDPSITDPGIVMMYDAVQHKADVSLTKLPDLLVIDGGKGQLSTVKDVLDAMQMQIPVIGLAKREEEVFVPGSSDPVIFRNDSPAKFLLMRLRNEAHRFANAHREKRLKNRTIGSILDEIPGIGPKARSLLLEKFGTVDGIKRASDEELRTVLNETQLASVRAHLEPPKEHH